MTVKSKFVSSVSEDGQTKREFLCTDRFQIGLQIEPDKAYLSFEDLSRNNAGHELAIGLFNGQPSIQICHDGDVRIVSLLEIIDQVKRT